MPLSGKKQLSLTQISVSNNQQTEGLTPYQAHKQRWCDCTCCPLSETRNKVVLARGSVPCEILFCGEGPGHSEDTLGRPFTGVAGHLLDSIIEKSIAGRVKYALTNLTACIPLGEDGQKTGEPDPDDILACAPRLEEFVSITLPKLIVCVGKLAENWLMGTKGKRHLLKNYECERVAIIHPSAILRSNVAQRSLLIQRSIVTIRNATDELLERMKEV